ALAGRAAGALRISGLLDARAATPEMIEALERAGPFGAGAPAPRFALSDLILEQVDTMGEGHLRLHARSGAGALDAVAWGAMQGALGPALLRARGRRFHLAGRLELSLWGGRQRVRLRLDDAAEPAGNGTPRAD
ncbi:MAG TPA: single-stranded-DNA-specific exonuclease RecJ, partial [Paracoccus solventivorans]|nr:single-stranded-DNA-specific exonuclease RecJ [Paracoccus solventivorans]